MNHVYCVCSFGTSFCHFGYLISLHCVSISQIPQTGNMHTHPTHSHQMPSRGLLEKRKLNALERTAVPAATGPSSEIRAARRAYIHQKTTTMKQHLPFALPTECACIIVEYLVALKVTVNYASHELSQFNQKGPQRPYDIYGWTSLRKSFEKSCSDRNQNMDNFVLKNVQGTLVPLDTVVDDLAMGTFHVQLIVCLRK